MRTICTSFMTQALSLTALLLTLTVCSRAPEEGQREDRAADQTSDDESPCPDVSRDDRVKVVAQVGEVELTVCDVTEALNKMSPYLRKAYEAPQKRKQFVDNMIRFELIAQEARRRGYDDDEEVQRVRKQMMIQRLNKALQESVSLGDITEEEMRQYYQEHESDYHKAEMVRIARIVLPTENAAKRILKQAQEKANDSRFFRELAQEHSTDEQTKEHGGDLPYFPRTEERGENDPEVDPALVEAAFTLEMREPLYSKVVKSSDGWNVIRLRGRRKARDLSFDDVKRQIQHRLHREKLSQARDNLVAELREKASITINESELAKVRVDIPPPPPGAPGAPGALPGNMPAATGAKAPAATGAKAATKAPAPGGSASEG
jgi:peptidyl-prolyl cis-trans isomerase C